MSEKLYGCFLVPFSEYPLTKKFSDNKLSKTILISSILLFSGLIVFNVLTQGMVKSTESLLEPHYEEKNSSVACQPATMTVGNSFFTNGIQEDDSPGQSQTRQSKDTRGSFSWIIEGVVNGIDGEDTQTGFQYQGSPLSCNVTSISITFDFQLQTFSYSICVLCSTRSVGKGLEEENYVTLCTSFSLLNNVLPKFTNLVQANLQTQIFGLSKFYHLLDIPGNSLPPGAFPDYSSSNKTPSHIPIPKRDILVLSSWLDAFNYTPANNYIPFDPKHLYLQPKPQGKLYTSPEDTEPRDFPESFVEMVSKNSSGFQFSAIGIGGIRPIAINVSLSEALKTVPDPLPLYINLTQSIFVIMMDAAAKDVNKRVLGVSYLCTMTKTSWKDFFPMLAMIFGSCSGTFGAALTLMIFLARRYDTHLESRRESISSGVSDVQIAMNSTNQLSPTDSITLEDISHLQREKYFRSEKKELKWDFV
ncbi:hypothetical protein BY996DRAFT_4591640 [Phakopsora pachyrhizi]|uniref:Uncharacterized protein n=1 Tax=Phakopsora pachyrhizi TaxID=170000 RepID=A0AAV0AF94_PHAPC|nr:hypothetical protein BY996DRAFT_4591640 [Phakopsora pachyrhizi]CAH7665744.1 hypothetical protein PPACK8108_LOCUS29 [Phakopsora pachyrhizi]